MDAECRDLGNGDRRLAAIETNTACGEHVHDRVVGVHDDAADTTNYLVGPICQCDGPTRSRARSPLA